MPESAGQSVSAWMSIPVPGAGPLDGDTSADVCVVGAGIAGLTTAYLLAREGRSVVVVDDGAIGGGETGRTTAHLTNAIDNRIFSIEEMHGERQARLAVESHMAAINRIEQLIACEQISCNFERVDGYLFVPPGESDRILHRELAAAQRAGLTDTTWATRAPFKDFDTGRCLRFPNQAAFHPLRYLAGLARGATALKVRIYGGTPVDEKIEEGRPVVVHTRSGHRITAQSLVVATNTPAINFLQVLTKQTAMRTYAIAASVPRGSIAPGLFWDTLEPYHYVRTFSDHAFDYDLLIVGGEDHKTGQDDDPTVRYDALEGWMRDRFPVALSVKYRWSGQVMEPIDGLAFIGRYDKGERNVYCITGDSGQGMTHGTLGAMLVTDLIMGRENPWAELYSPARKRLAASGAFVEEAVNNVAQYADLVTAGDVKSVADIMPGSGAIMRRGFHKVAVYRDPAGGLHEHSAVCTHLGCVVRWNDAEHTWDCPCHGSRFNPVGEVINGPAVDPLPPAGRTARRKTKAAR